MDVQRIESLLKAAGSKPAKRPEFWERASKSNYMAHEDVREYLFECIPAKDVRIGTVRLPGLNNVLAYNFCSHPGEILIGPFFSLATTGRGDSRDSGNDNVVCVHLETGRVYWASYKRFRSKMEINWNANQSNTGLQSVLKKLELVSENLEAFLVALLTGELEEKLREFEFSTGLPVSKAEMSTRTPDYQLDRKLYLQISDLVREGKINEGIAICEARLTALAPTPFHVVLGKTLQSQRVDLCAWMARIWQAARLHGIESPAEMFIGLNEFELNTARWYSEGVVALERAMGSDARFGSPSAFCFAEPYALKGFEELQIAYDAMCRKEELSLWRKAGSTTMFLVTLHWMELFQAAAEAFERELAVSERVKIYCGVHDWDMNLVMQCEGQKALK